MAHGHTDLSKHRILTLPFLKCQTRKQCMTGFGYYIILHHSTCCIFTAYRSIWIRSIIKFILDLGNTLTIIQSQLRVCSLAFSRTLNHIKHQRVKFAQLSRNLRIFSSAGKYASWWVNETSCEKPLTHSSWHSKLNIQEMDRITVTSVQSNSVQSRPSIHKINPLFHIVKTVSDWERLIPLNGCRLHYTVSFCLSTPCTCISLRPCLQTAF